MARAPVVVTGVNLPTATVPPEERPPLGLGMVMAYARKTLGADARFDLAPRFARSFAEIERVLERPGRHVLLYSDYMWSTPANLDASRRAKALRPDAVNVHGGPNVPRLPDRCEAFLRREPHVDFVVHGEGEATLADLLRSVADGPDRDAAVPGTSTIAGGRFVQHAARERVVDLDELPSPYLDGTFDTLDAGRWIAGIIESNRGCPYGCTFCDWGSATLQKIRTFDLERVRAEVEWLAKRRVPTLWTADANSGILPRDVEVARIIVEAKRKYGFPKVLITQFAKNTHKHLLEILELYIEAGLVSNGIVSLQTRDARTLDIVRRTNIKTAEYDKLRAEFQRRGLPLAVQLMIGLPGATLRSLKDDLAFYFDEPIEVQVFRTVLVPNAPMAEPAYMAAHGIVHREDGLVTRTSTMSSDDFATATLLVRAFNAAHHFGVLRYPLALLARDHGAQPLDVLSEIAAADRALDARFPWLRRLLIPQGDELYLFEAPAALLEQCRREDAWRALSDELFAFVSERRPIVRTSAWDAVCAAQAAVMPVAGRSYPHTEALEHDVAAWYRDARAGRARPLAEYGRGTLTVADPLGSAARAYSQERATRWHWELASPLALARVGKEAGRRAARAAGLDAPDVALPWAIAAT